MDNALINALHLLSHFWLEEIRPPDLGLISTLPELGETLVPMNEAALTDLAVEYQRLFGFNLPPYESVFVDPSVMLLAPAAARVQALYRQAGWTLPVKARVGAPDHLGLELLALGEIKAKAEAKEELGRLAYRLHTQHLALWVPAFSLTLHRLKPHPFYAILADLTLELLLSTLPADSPSTIHYPLSTAPDPFPTLPPPPVYDREGRLIPPDEREPEMGLREVVRRLLTPCESGLFLTREDIARIGRALDVPAVMGERSYMLETLFRQAGEYELVPALLAQLRQLLAEVEAAYQAWVEVYPAWSLYAAAWHRRITATQDILISQPE
jgi:TorA maturation chaperone TorD